MPSPSLAIPLNVQQSATLIRYFESIITSFSRFEDFKTSMRSIDRDYHRENDLSDDTVESVKAKLLGKTDKLRNVEIPLVKPQVESVVTYLTSVFLTGHPIFGVTSGPKNIDTALQWNTLMIDHAAVGKWAANLQMYFRDGVKYNLNGLEVTWGIKTIPVFETDATSTKMVRSVDSSNTQKEIFWEGNVLKRLDMYNTFFDLRVSPSQVHEHAEFAGYHELVSRIEFKRRLRDLNQPSLSNTAKAISSSFNPNLFELPTISNTIFSDRDTNRQGAGINWQTYLNGAEGKDRAKGVNWSESYIYTTLYARIIPADFGLFSVKAKSTPQLWKFIIINGTVPIYAERLSTMHDYMPIVIGQPFDDGLGLQSKSVAADVVPFQDASSTLWTSRLQAARRRISDRMVYDSNVISPKDINKPDASAKIPARLPSFNADIRRHVMHLPFEDSASTAFSQEISSLAEFSFYASGQNRVQQGQFQKGNKTLEEFNTTMQNANGRNQSLAIFIEAQSFTPIKHMLKLNIMQNQTQVDLYNPVEDRQVTIDPKTLREQAIQFKISDGMLPASKLMGTDDFAVAMQFIGSNPTLSQEYKVGDVFSYLFKLRGVEGLDNFKYTPAELMYKQQLASWQQVAMEAAKSGAQIPPQPQPPKELLMEQQQQQSAQSNQSVQGV